MEIRKAGEEREDAARRDVEAPPLLRVLVVAPSLDMLGGQSRQAARLIGRLREEPSLEMSFLAVNPRLPGMLRKLQDVKYVRTVVTTLWYWATLLRRAGKYDVLHVFSASYYSYMLSAMPAILVGAFR